jgi:thioredoxin 2
MSLEGYTGLVLFGAPWCQPCKTARAQLDGLDHRYVDVDKDPELAIAFGVVGVPQLISLRDGKEAARASHVMRATAIEMGRNL